MVYDIIIIWWWAAGLFCSLFLPQHSKKCIIEKTERLGTKVLMSWWERCNLTNSNLDPKLHYVGQFLKSLPSLFHQFWPEDMINYLIEYWIEIKIEDNGRVLLKSGKSKQLVDFLVDQSHKNTTEHILNHEVFAITYVEDDSFVVTTSAGVFSAKRVIVASWWMTYPQIGASLFAYEMAEQLWLMFSKPHGALCGIEIQEDFSLLAWNTVQAIITLFKDNKKLYTNRWSLLFTHRGFSWPIVFDATLYIDGDISKYSLQIDFDLSWTSKKVIQVFKLIEGDTIRDFRIKILRSIQEAKVSVWWICLKDLDQGFQSKKIPWLYFVGESLDITGKTWWFNLQRAWTSAYVCAKHIKISGHY
jgi:predicted Rossmann fold flavoprotein